jgi:ribose/xylose/arabinose/galactoside ABC-type transport system permease subunit
MMELIARFLIGGVVVSSFALLGEIFRPKSFAGLFGAAPSIALATLGLTILHQGHEYAAVEARSMVLGALAFFCYANAVSWILRRFKLHALVTTLVMMPVWFGVAFGLHLLMERWLA